MVLKHAVDVVTEEWFPRQADNMSMFVEPAFALDIGRWFCYRHRCVVDFDYDNTFQCMFIVAESILEY